MRDRTSQYQAGRPSGANTKIASTIPNGLTVVSVDYDEATELKQKYGVTVQHTFVQVSPDGSELAKWSGSTTASEIESKVV